MGKKSLIKSLIFKDDGTGEQEIPDTKTQSKGPAPQTPIVKPSMNIQGVADNKFIDLLEKIIEDNNIPGPDYFEFKQAIENMQAVTNLDEKTKFITVYSVLSLQGCKKDVLLSSLDHYVKLIQNEKANFNVELKSAYAEKVQSKLDQAEKSKKELETLSKRLTELNNAVLSLSQEAQAEENKIRASEANFQASADMIINEMINDKQKINNYIA